MRVWFFLALFLVISLGAHAARYTIPYVKPQYGAIVMDAKTSEILHEDGADTRVPPASLTKMMTLYLAFEALERKKISLDTPVYVSKHAVNQDPSKLGLKAGSFHPMRVMIMGAVTRSANDATVAIAEALAGDEPAFARQLTAKARALGMRNTSFGNASGLPHVRNMTTARDMAVLSRSLINHFPKYYKLFRTKAFNFKGQEVHNHNKLLGKFEGLDGIKTGFTNNSAFNLAASAVRGNKRLIAVVLGGPTRHKRDARITHLLETCFQGEAPQEARLYGPQKRTSKRQNISRFDSIDDVIAAHAPGADYDQPKLIFSESKVARTKKSSNKWSIQTAVFKNNKMARAEAARITKHLKMKAQVAKHGKFYKVQLVHLDKRVAHKSCGSLKKKGFSCMLMAPRKQGIEVV